jgi:hypothetical protein
MTTQPEALRLADEVQRPYIKASAWEKEAATELRRLHESNTELLAALKEIDSWLVCACIATPEDMAQSFPTMQQVASAAINKAERTTT